MIWRIRSRASFERLRSHGTRVKSGPVRMMYVSGDSRCPQVAFAFGRRFGSAVERNRARRRVRAAFAEVWTPADASGDYLVSASRSVLKVDFKDLTVSIRRCVDQLSVVPAPEGRH